MVRTDAVTPTPSGVKRYGHSSGVRRKHPVQGSGSDGDFGRFGLIGPRSQGIADHALVSADRCLDLGPQIVAARFLPGHPAVRDDLLDVSVTLCRGGPGGRTRHRGCSRRHVDSGIRITLGDRLADLVLIVGAVSGEGRNGIGELVEQCGSPRGIVDIFLGQRDRNDLAALGIDADMQLAPRSAAGRSMLFNQPFAGPAELQAGAVH